MIRGARLLSVVHSGTPSTCRLLVLDKSHIVGNVGDLEVSVSYSQPVCCFSMLCQDVAAFTGHCVPIIDAQLGMCLTSSNKVGLVPS